MANPNELIKTYGLNVTEVFPRKNEKGYLVNDYQIVVTKEQAKSIEDILCILGIDPEWVMQEDIQGKIVISLDDYSCELPQIQG